MRTGARATFAMLGVFLILIGLACLNYTKPSTLEHHRDWARETGAPPPGPAIQYAGFAAMALGVGGVSIAVLACRRR